MNAETRALETGDVFTWYNECLDAYTACQVIKTDHPDNVEILFLNWIGEEPLTADNLTQVKPLHIDAFFQEEKYCVYSVEPIVPDGFSYVTNVEPFIEEESNRCGCWDSLGWELPYQRKWEKIPLENRVLFRASKDDNTLVSFNGVNIPRNIRKIDDREINIHDLNELRVFPCVVELKLKNYHPGLTDYLKAHPFITNLTLESPDVATLDLRDTHIKKLVIDLKKVSSLYIGDALETLQTINQEAENCYISSINKGGSIILCQKNSNIFHPELNELKQLSLCNIIDLDLGLIAHNYPNLEILELNGAAGSLHHFEKIGEIKNLKKLFVYNFNDIFIDYLPDPDKMLNLRSLQMTGVPKEIGRKVIDLFRIVAHRDENFHLSVSNLR